MTSLRLVVEGVDLGNDGESECEDCDDEDDDDLAPSLIVVPIDGGTVSIQADDVSPGTYGRAEIDLVGPTPSLLAADPGWTAGATIEVTGSYGGAPFALPLPIEGELHQTLNPPVTVGAAGEGTIAITVTPPWPPGSSRTASSSTRTTPRSAHRSRRTFARRSCRRTRRTTRAAFGARVSATPC